MTSCKLEDVIIRDKKARQTWKSMTCFVIEIIASENHRPRQRGFFEPGKQAFDVSLIKRRVSRRGLEADVGGHQIDERALPPSCRYSATGA